jgi:hypothetical protein
MGAPSSRTSPSERGTVPPFFLFELSLVLTGFVSRVSEYYINRGRLWRGRFPP